MRDTPDNMPQNKSDVFEEVALRSFDFLEKHYGFTLDRIRRDYPEIGHVYIGYTTAKLFLELHYGPPGFEIDVSFGRIGVEDREGHHRCVAGDLLYLNPPSHCAKYSRCSASTVDRVRELVPKRAQFVKECGDLCLRGISEAFEEIARKRAHDARHWHEAERIRQRKAAASDAWSARDLTQVINLYEPIRDKLSPAELKRLEYAKKHR